MILYIGYSAGICIFSPNCRIQIPYKIIKFRYAGAIKRKLLQHMRANWIYFLKELRYVLRLQSTPAIKPLLLRSLSYFDVFVRGLEVGLHNNNNNKKAELPQRWPRNAPYIWVPWKFSRVPEYAHGYFPEIFIGILLRSILWMCAQNLNFVALPVPEIIATEVLCGGCEPPFLGKRRP